MSPLNLLLVAAIAAAAPLAAAAGGAPANGVANDVLPEFGLPKGLVPDSVVSYTFDNDTGSFEIDLAGACYIWFGTHLVYYEKTIAGRLSYGAISDLSGIQTKKLFIWVSLSGMVAHPDKGTIEFYAGFISEELPASMFEKIPFCGAGERLRGAAGVIRELGLLPVAEV